MNSHNNPAETKRLLSEHSLRRALAAENRKVPQAADEIDEAAADPIHDHRPQAAPSHKVRGVLGVLDQLDRNTNRRFTT